MNRIPTLWPKSLCLLHQQFGNRISYTESRWIVQVRSCNLHIVFSLQITVSRWACYRVAKNKIHIDNNVSLQYRDHVEIMAYTLGGRYKNPATPARHDRKKSLILKLGEAPT
jgi:hypothetical protein